MRVVELHVPPGDMELAIDRLWGSGVQAVEELGLVHGREVLRTILSDDDEISLRRLGRLRDGWQIEYVDVDDEPAQTWRQFAEPVYVTDDIVIRPAWIDPSPHRPMAIDVAIEPGAAFGLGDHPTTRLSVAAVARLVRPGAAVLDVGSGTGVLGIVAARLGAARVVAIDIADAAVEACRDNAVRNGVADVIDVSTTPIADVDGEFDVVLANILAPTLVALADDLVRCTGPHGRLVCSGVLVNGYDHVVAALSPMTVVDVAELDGWAAVTFAKG